MAAELTELEVPGQPEAERLLRRAATDPGHAYLFHGPPGSGMDEAARELSARLLEDRHRVELEVHPDLFVLEREGEEIRIEQVRNLLHDVAMRPFEATRRVYIVRDSDAPLLREMVTERFGRTARIEFAQADLCRRELLVEIEGVAAL